MLCSRNEEAADDGEGESESQKVKASITPRFPGYLASSDTSVRLHCPGKCVAKACSSFVRDKGFVRKSSAPAALNKA